MAKKTSFLILSVIIFVMGLVSVYKPIRNTVTQNSSGKELSNLPKLSASATSSVIGGDNTKAEVNQDIKIKTNLTPGVGDTTTVKE